MQKEWSSFRITLLLYLVVLILPFSFYFVYKSFQTMQNDTRIVRQSSWVSGSIGYLTLNQDDQQTAMHIDKALHEISLWVTQNNDSKLYIGSQTLSEDFSKIQSCWIDYKEYYSQDNNVDIIQHGLQCYKLTDTMAVVIEKMVYLKQKKIINVFYLNLILATIFALLMIYLMRIYMHIQMKKHAIHDHETRLFNKKYFMSELKITCSRSARHGYPLSILCVAIDNFEKENKTYKTRTKRNTLKVFGILIHSLVRDGDIPCRYDENHFFVLLPFAGQENALVLEERIRQSLEKDNWMRSNKIVFRFKITEFDKKESEEAFITRTLDRSELRG